MTGYTPTPSNPENNSSLPDSVFNAVCESITAYDGVGINHHDIGVQVISQTTTPPSNSDHESETCEVLIDATGRFDLREVLDDNDLLLYTKNDIEITLLGFEDGSILVSVTYPTHIEPGEGT